MSEDKARRRRKGSPERSDWGTCADERWAQIIAGGDAPTFSAAQQAKMSEDKARRRRKGSPERSDRGTCADERWAQIIAEGDAPSFSIAKQSKKNPDQGWGAGPKGRGGASPH
ncbi:hypothetical protein LBMAG53_31110 [Planctomycetota bacterium]|nr:hypothetical protein LBMAG53_31110 [Planctomycetota bacterium]